MALTFTPRAGVSIMHGSSLDDTLRSLRLLELSGDLDLTAVVGIREGDPHRSALVDGMRGRGTILPIVPTASDAEAHNAVLTELVRRDVQYVWTLRPELVIGSWTLGVLTKHMTAVPDCAVVGARIMRFAEPQPLIWSDGGTVSVNGSVKRLSAGLSRRQAPKAKPVDVDAVHRAGSLYRVAALQTVGLFGDDDEVDGHDVGWSDRARQAGWRVMVQRRARPQLEGVNG